eukprot:symbB.v1.2.028896.t1/scaffold3107.1/size63424/8
MRIEPKDGYLLAKQRFGKPTECLVQSACSCHNRSSATVAINDHQPPPLAEILRFLELVQAWMNKSRTNIVAVHCRGGKGRTGSFCCAWLLYTKEADDAEDALNFFALRRTDMAKRTISKVQGVETPSQVRYVGYVERLLRKQAALEVPGLLHHGFTHQPFSRMRFSPSTVSTLTAPEVRLQSLTIRAPFFKESLGDKILGQQLVAVVKDVHGQSHEAAPFLLNQLNEDQVWTFDQKLVCGDVCISVCLAGPEAAGHIGREKPKKRKQKQLFGFTVHTLFLEGQQLLIPVTEVDQACKEPSQYDSNGSLVLDYAIL